MRASLAAPGDLAARLAAPRVASMEENAPPSRVRQVSAYVEEHWSPIYRSTDSTDLATILVASQQQVGWRVTQRESQSSRRARKAAFNAQHFAEVAQSAQIQANDAFYAGYYETIPGNDPVILDGEILRAQDGTVIRGGTQIATRKQYEQKTKGMVHWDKGFVAQKWAAEAEHDSRPMRNVRVALERVRGEVLPMRRLIANGRYDRRSAV
jgi:hypothetical protein